MARRALLLANDAFADPSIPALASPCSDCERLRDLLAREDIGGYDVIYHANPSSVEARIAVQSFFRGAGAGDFNLILISGHGIRDSQGHLHFATADTQSDVLAATSLDAAFVIKQMDLSAASKQVAVIDTCYSGAFVHGMVAKAAAQRISRTDFDNAEIDNIRGRAVITASTHIQTANENEVGGLSQSVFTRHLIEGIETGAADADGDGEIALPELFDYVSARLKAEGSVQTPRSYDYGLGGRVVIAHNPAHAPAELPTALQKKLASRSKAQKLLAVEQLHEIAIQGGADAPVALVALQKLLRDDFALVRQMAQDTLDGLNIEPQSSLPAPAPLAASLPVEEEIVPAATDTPSPAVDGDAGEEPQPSSLPKQKNRILAGRKGRIALLLAAMVFLIFFALPTLGIIRSPLHLFSSGDNLSSADDFDVELETNKMAGKWVWSLESGGCDNTTTSRMVISVTSTEITISDQTFPRYSIGVAEGWLTIGDRYFRLPDSSTLLLARYPQEDNGTGVTKFLRCEFGSSSSS